MARGTVPGPPGLTTALERFLVAAAIALVLAASAWGVEPGASYRGRALTDVLLELSQDGVRLVFSSQLVRSDMRVLAEPSSTDPEAIARELLAQHGLALRSAPGGRWVVVAGEKVGHGSLTGRIVDRRSGEPLAGVQVLIAETDGRVATDGRGRFIFPALEPGRYTVEGSRPGFVSRRRRVNIRADGRTDLDLDLEPLAVVMEATVIDSSVNARRLTEPVASYPLTREDIHGMPLPSRDSVRAAALLPGTASNDLSAELHVRGGRADEVAVVFDGLELYRPFHLKDFNSALSILTPASVGDMELRSGGLPAAYGDRMGGVLDVRTVEPGRELRAELGFSGLDGYAVGSGRLPWLGGDWLVSGRRGLLDRASQVLERDEVPTFWDAFAKLTLRPGLSHRVDIRGLEAVDELRLEDFGEGETSYGLLPKATDDPLRDFHTRYRSIYAWAGHQWLLDDNTFVYSLLFIGDVDDRRFADQLDTRQAFHLDDRRSLDILGFKQDWSRRFGERHTLNWGFATRRLESDFVFYSALAFDDPLAAIRTHPAGITESEGLVQGRQASFYVSDRLRPISRLTVDLGLRWDENQLTEGHHVSPRFGLLYELGPKTSLRLSASQLTQSQRSYELQVADGETAYARDERAFQVVLGLDHDFANGVGLHVEAYQHRVETPRTRYENLFEPIAFFPELEADRVRFEPRRAQSQGLEMVLRRSGRLSWFWSYTMATTGDDLDVGPYGQKPVSRSYDQPHTVRATASYGLGRHTTLGTTFTYRTGWPTTVLRAELVPSSSGEPEIVPVLGPINGERLPDYHRLDIRLSHTFPLRRGALELYVDVLNVYDQFNPRGYEFDFQPEEDGSVTVLAEPKAWGRRIPSLGLRLSF